MNWKERTETIGVVIAAVALALSAAQQYLDQGDKDLSRQLEAQKVISASNDANKKIELRYAVEIITRGGKSLNGSAFEGADFSYLPLKDGKFSWSHWQGANLQGADLRGAAFVKACFDGVRLNDAKIEGADFSGACIHNGSRTGMIGTPKSNSKDMLTEQNCPAPEKIPEGKTICDAFFAESIDASDVTTSENDKKP